MKLQTTPLIRNSIEKQTKQPNQRIPIKEWNQIVNALRTQANANTKAIENLDFDPLKVPVLYTNDEIESIIDRLQATVAVVVDITIHVSDWNARTAYIAVEGVTVDNAIVIDLNEVEANVNAWHEFGLKATTQATDVLGFVCTTTPTVDIDVSVLVGGVPAVLNETTATRMIDLLHFGYILPESEDVNEGDLFIKIKEEV